MPPKEAASSKPDKQFGATAYTLDSFSDLATQPSDRSIEKQIQEKGLLAGAVFAASLTSCSWPIQSA
jgi:hypothetical protein